MSRPLRSLFQKVPKPPSEIDLARARMRELTAALNEKRPTVPPPRGLRELTSRSLEAEIDGSDEESPDPK